MEHERYVKLIMVTGENNNKYYEMIHDGGSTFTVNYGRVEHTKVTCQKGIYEWDTLYRSKVKKGYKDVTDIITTKEDKKDNKKSKKKEAAKIAEVKELQVAAFLKAMKAYTDGLVASTYSVKCDAVTQVQIDTAQKLINELVLLDPKKQETVVNTKLLELYTIIPRFMRKVNDYLLPSIDFSKTMVQEQDNLDAMASQVKMYADKPEEEEEVVTPKEQTLLDLMGVKMEEVKNPAELQYLLKQVTHGVRIESVFKVEKNAETETFQEWLKKQKDQSTRYLIHGTRCTSVIPILEQGLKIRPKGNFQFSGKAYGDGNYFSEVVQKSLGYTGYSADKILLVYEVHTGKPFVYEGWYRGNQFQLCYEELNKRGFDSTHVKAGSGLLNSEIIAYKEEQCHIKYIIWLK